MTNWFYMNRQTFEGLLHSELGAHLASKLISMDFNTPVSFFIGETSDQILSKIQQTFSRHLCGRIICTDQCLSCTFSPPNYAKLAWFVQRLLVMSPLTKPFIQQNATNKLSTETSTSVQSKNSTKDQQYSSPINDHFKCEVLSVLLWTCVVILILLAILL